MDAEGVGSGEGDTKFSQCSNITVEKVLRLITPKDLSLKRTHIVCTMGPSSSELDTVIKMIDAGMNICRFNFSHGTHKSHGEVLATVRKAMSMRPECNIALLLDLKGPEVRTGMLKDHKPVFLEAGQTLKITTDYTYEGTAERIGCSYSKLTESAKVGNTVLIADGSITCKIVSIGKGEIEVKVLNSAQLGERKNVNFPNTRVDLPILSERDKDDLINFAIPNGMHFVALSFVRCAADVREARGVLGEAGKHIRLISKIENVDGLRNYDEILEVSDGIMIARGDLGMEIPIEKVCLAQKMMIRKANLAAKPIITATQMLESMVNNPRPTRAESADVVNAVLDGTDCVMLSCESAGGKYPVECVSVMSKLCFEAENCFSYRKTLYERITSPHPRSLAESISRAAAFLACDVNAELIVALTLTGNTARLISKYRPSCIIISLSLEEHIRKCLTASRGIVALGVDSFQDPHAAISGAIEVAKSRGIVSVGSLVVAVFGEDPTGSMPCSDILKILKVK